MDENMPAISHPDSARYDAEKAKLKNELENFGFPKPPRDIHEFNEDKARERLALVLSQIQARKWEVTPDDNDYAIADQFIGILRMTKEGN